MNPTINDSPAQAGCPMADETSSRITPRYTSSNIIDLTQSAPASLLGGHSVSDTPDPISNSAVKPDCADGTYA